ncbi:hypothetical protein B0H11DRAFT_1945555 [Mycena galericulata]|nr:hypothetical protein B0H11DRAFT_1945555 [Mycena galericulata]
MIQSSNWVHRGLCNLLASASGRNWQGGAQFNNPEFELGTTKGGYMDWTQLARVRIGYHRRRIHGLNATGKVVLNPIIQSSDRVPPKADTWTGRHWQGGTQSNNQEVSDSLAEHTINCTCSKSTFHIGLRLRLDVSPVLDSIWIMFKYVSLEGSTRGVYDLEYEVGSKEHWEPLGISAANMRGPLTAVHEFAVIVPAECDSDGGQGNAE